MTRRIVRYFSIFVFFLSAAHAQWVPIGPDSAANIICLSIDSDNTFLYAGTYIGFWYYDFGSQTWTRREDIDYIGREVHAVLPVRSHPGRIITGRANAFFKGYLEISDDWGETGSVTYNSDGGTVSDIENHPDFPDTVFACTFPDISPGEFLKSVDGGVTWTRHPNPIHYWMTGIAISQAQPNTVYVSGDARVTKSTDGGATWAVVSSGLPDGLGVYSIALNPGSDSTVIVSNDDGIYRSENGAVFSHQAEFVARFLRWNPIFHNICAGIGFDSGIVISFDSGTTWQVLPEQIISASAYDILFSQDGTRLYASTDSAGVFYYDLPLTGAGDDTDNGQIFQSDASAPQYTIDLRQNFPNPFNASTEISFTLRQPSSISLTLYTLLGEQVRTLLREELSAGDYTVHLDADELPSGIYYYVLNDGVAQSVKKLTLLK